MMDAWHILSVLCVCALGALTFLKLVADELEAVSHELRAVHRRELAREGKAEIDAPADSAIVESVVEKLA